MGEINCERQTPKSVHCHINIAQDQPIYLLYPKSVICDPTHQNQE